MPTRLRRILPAFPYFHFMAFAPLDVWARLLFQDRALTKIPPRYYLRLLGGLASSTLATALTLPERLVLGPILRARYSNQSSHQRVRESASPDMAGGPLAYARGSDDRGSVPHPPILIILGYYRSGTTHLHYLLSCDPALVTPRWYQMLAPQGFALSWGFLRYFLVPFLSSTRPQDDVAFGSEYPAEDDFGVCNWSASCALPGRMALPGCWSFYSRFHSLESLTNAELERFRRTQFSLTWKLGVLNPRRTILLKTPSHTARVRELVDLYGDRVKFLHLHRDPTPVLRSNVAMHRRFEPFLLQDLPGDEEIRRRIIAEYDATERRFLADAAALPDAARGVISRVRYEDLIADPVGELRRAYAELGLAFTPEFDSRVRTYLDTVRDYRSASERTKTKSDHREQIAAAPELDWMHGAFGHDRPSIPKVESATVPSTAPPDVAALSESRCRTPDDARTGRPQGRTSGGTGQSTNPYLTALVAAAWCIAAWIAVAYFKHDRMDFLIWPVGIAIGLAALRSAGRGTFRLGLWAAALTLAVLAITAYPATWLADYADRDPVPWDHVWLSTRRGVLATNNFIWMILGVMTAFRFASREHMRPPGL